MRSELLDEIHEKLVRSLLDFVILQELTKRPLGCHDVISLVRDKHHIELSPGTVYTCLYTLESDGLVRSELNSSKRIFMLTDRGRDVTMEFLGAKTKILGLLLDVFVEE